jgi:FAD/FMN-containing dehydrogenase
MEGTTGIILSVKLKTIDSPVAPTISIFSFSTITALVDKVKELKEDARIKSIEYIDELCSDYIGLGDDLHIIAEFEGAGGDIEDIEEIEGIYAIRNKLSTHLKSAKYIISEDPEVPLENLDKFLHWLRQWNIPTFGHIGKGIIHPHFKENENRREEMFKVLKQLGGKAGGEHGIGLTKKEFIDEEELKKNMVMKTQYDPRNIMNRGKLV